jgi:hypothetical protein
MASDPTKDVARTVADALDGHPHWTPELSAAAEQLWHLALRDTIDQQDELARLLRESRDTLAGTVVALEESNGALGRTVGVLIDMLDTVAASLAHAQVADPDTKDRLIDGCRKSIEDLLERNRALEAARDGQQPT